MADSAEDRNMTENLLPLEVFTMLGIGVFVIVLRTIARINAVGVGAFQLDDYLMLAAAIIYGLETGTAYVILDWWEDMANSGMTPEARQNLDPDSREYYLRVGGSKTQIVQWTFYVLLLWTLKACMCLFYSRLTASLHEFEIRVKLGYALIGLTYLATQLCILLGCQPFHSSWQINPEPPNFCQPAISKLNLYTTLTLNIATDLYLLSIPVPMLWRANLATWRRFSLLIIFSGGIFVMLCGIMRCYIVLKDPVAGAQKATTWACRETFLAVLTTNAPVVYPLFRRGVERVASGSWKLSHIYRFSSDRSAWSVRDRGVAAASSSFGNAHGRTPAFRRSVNALPTDLSVSGGTVVGYGEGVVALGTWRGAEGDGFEEEEEEEERDVWGRASRDYIVRTPVSGEGKDIESLSSGGRGVIGYGGSRAALI